MQDSLNVLIIGSQRGFFQTEISDVIQSKLLKNNSLRSLNPSLDNDGIIRVGGRPRNGKISFELKFPILLSGKHTLARLIIGHEYGRLVHAGPQLLMASTRQHYWLTGGFSGIKSVTGHYIVF